MSTLTDRVVDGLRIPRADAATAREARRRWDLLAMPRGALGDLHDVGVRLAGLAGACPPPVPTAPLVLVAAGDHGVTAQGVSAWPQAVTAAMVRTCASGRAAVSAVARTVGARVVVVDVGVAAELDDAPGVLPAKVRRGTRDLSSGAAMTGDELVAAVTVGRDTVTGAIDDGADLVALGEVGIGNTTAAACCIAAYTDAPAAAVVGRGAGLDDAGLARKTGVVTRALRRHQPVVARTGSDPLAALAALGGLEHAALVGAVLAAAERRVPVVLDGVNSVAVALAAVAAVPAVRAGLFAGHLPTEPGASVGLAQLGLIPLQRLDLRLGEGTGALLAVPLLQAAARCLGQTALLSEVSPPG